MKEFAITFAVFVIEAQEIFEISLVRVFNFMFYLLSWSLKFGLDVKITRSFELSIQAISFAYIWPILFFCMFSLLFKELTFIFC